LDVLGEHDGIGFGEGSVVEFTAADDKAVERREGGESGFPGIRLEQVERDKAGGEGLEGLEASEVGGEGLGAELVEVALDALPYPASGTESENGFSGEHGKRVG
jgi:hypothetical protein